MTTTLHIQARVETHPSAWAHRVPAILLALLGAASSEAVLTSSLTRLLPLPDATLAALAGLAVTSLVLVASQIFVVHALCSLCLCSAAISFINAWLGHDEVLATWRTHAQ